MGSKSGNRGPMEMKQKCCCRIQDEDFMEKIVGAFFAYWSGAFES
jgi:hypothetical protein